MALRERRTAKRLLRARFGILRRSLQGADELLLRLGELLLLQRRRAQLGGDQAEHQRQVFLQALGVHLQRLQTDTEGDFGSDVVQLLGNGELVEGLGAAVQHHAGERRHRDIARLGHGIARWQRPEDHHHVLHVGVVGDQIDSGDRRALAVVGHACRGGAARREQHGQKNCEAPHVGFSAAGGSGMNQPVVL